MANPTSETNQEGKESRSVLGWIWRGLVAVLLGRRNMDFEKRLQHLSKEEVAVHSRLKRRTHTWRKVARGIIMYAVVIEGLALGLALFSARVPDMPWNLRAVRVLPVFLVPGIASLVYTICSRYYHMRERKDQRTLEKLRAERQTRIDELKRKTNYYATQELIQRYDLDPTAKAAAASVLAAKLGAESGMNVAFKSAEGGAESSSSPTGTSPSDNGLRNRKSPQLNRAKDRQPAEQQGFLKALEDEFNSEKEREALERDAAVDRAKGRVGVGAGGGWLSRVAAMLVGEDPSQCYALICKYCHMHNGLAPKEEYQYITYVCPHCHTLNGGRQLGHEDNQERIPPPTVEEPLPAQSASFQQAESDNPTKSSSQFTTHTAESEIADS